MSDTTNLLILGAVAFGGYFLFKNKIDDAVEDSITPLQGNGNVSLITPIPDVIYNYYQENPESITNPKNIFSSVPNVITPIPNAIIEAIKRSSNKNKNNVTTKKQTPSYKNGTLTFSGQGYSVAPQKASKLSSQLTQSVYTKRDINPYD